MFEVLRRQPGFFFEKAPGRHRLMRGASPSRSPEYFRQDEGAWA